MKGGAWGEESREQQGRVGRTPPVQAGRLTRGPAPTYMPPPARQAVHKRPRATARTQRSLLSKKARLPCICLPRAPAAQREEMGKGLADPTGWDGTPTARVQAPVPQVPTG